MSIIGTRPPLISETNLYELHHGTSGGIDRYLLRFIEQVWEEDIQIDFLSDRSAYELKKRLEKYKSRVFQVSSLWHPVTQYRQMQKIIQENGYDVVY